MQHKLLKCAYGSSACFPIGAQFFSHKYWISGVPSESNNSINMLRLNLLGMCVNIVPYRLDEKKIKWLYSRLESPLVRGIFQESQRIKPFCVNFMHIVDNVTPMWRDPRPTYIMLALDQLFVHKCIRSHFYEKKLDQYYVGIKQHSQRSISLTYFMFSSCILYNAGSLACIYILIYSNAVLRYAFTQTRKFIISISECSWISSMSPFPLLHVSSSLSLLTQKATIADTTLWQVTTIAQLQTNLDLLILLLDIDGPLSNITNIFNLRSLSSMKRQKKIYQLRKMGTSERMAKSGFY